jgi:nucleotide-binding universal stress UspA family protein
MDDIRTPTILVGVSGSRASVAALRWAASESRLRGARLIVLRCWEPDQRAYYAAHGPAADAARRRRAATAELAATLHSEFGGQLPASLSGEVIEGVAERILVDRSAAADLLVIGSTSAPCLSGRSIGPVIRGCLSRAHCPVVVIGPEGPATDAALGPRRTVPRRAVPQDELARVGS